MGTVTCWATQQLADALDALELCDGVSTELTEAARISGDVSVGDRKGKLFPVYSLDVELPWSGMVDGVRCSGVLSLPDVSLEMLDDLEVSISIFEGSPPAELHTSGVSVVQAAVRSWAAAVRKAVAENAASWDPPTQTRQPRAAALISEEEAMSAGGSRELDEAIEDGEEGEEGEEEPPFTEDEVEELFAAVLEAFDENFSPEDSAQQKAQLEGELADKDLQERGRVLDEVMDFLQNELQNGEGGNGEEGEESEGGAQGNAPKRAVEPYRGTHALEELWNEVVEMCAEEEIPGIEEGLVGKSSEERWKMLLDIRDYLVTGDADEQEAYEKWQPSEPRLDEEWDELAMMIPPEEREEIDEQWPDAGYEEKRAILWDVRKFVAEKEEAAARGEDEAYPAEPDGVGRSEVRRRRGLHEEGAEPLADDDDDDDDDAGRSAGRGTGRRQKRAGGTRGWRSAAVGLGLAALLGGAVLILAATALGEEDESFSAAAARLLHLQ
jgi:hypothetical protein